MFDRARREGELNPKRLELLKETVPAVSRVAVLGNATSSNFGPSLKAVELAARSLGLQLQILEVRDSKDFDSAFETAKRGRAAALIVLPSTMFFSQRRRIADLALKGRLPTISADMDYIDARGLIAYGPCGTGGQVCSWLTLYCHVSHKAKPGWGDPVRAMMRDQRCDRIAWPSRS